MRRNDLDGMLEDVVYMIDMAEATTPLAVQALEYAAAHVRVARYLVRDASRYEIEAAQDSLFDQQEDV